MKRKLFPIGLMITVVMLVTTACAVVDDVKNVAETVDEGSSLLQDLNENRTGKYLESGIAGLVNQTAGYQAVIHLQEGTGDAAGTFSSTTRDVTINMQVDGQNDGYADLVTGEQTYSFFVDGNPGTTAGSNVYRVDQGRYVCVNELQEAQLLRGGISGVFDQYALETTGLQLLTVAKKQGDETVAGRTATHYTIEPRIKEALEVLKSFDSGELRDRVNQAGQFELSGDLYIDQETETLLGFHSRYFQTETQHLFNLSFDVIQWGGVPDLPEPTPDLIDVPCS